jgi:hypothetical protein
MFIPAANGSRFMDRRTQTQELNKLQVAVLLEEYKSRSQELIGLQNENNRWGTVYLSALTIVVGLLITNDKYGTLQDFFYRGDNAYFIVSLALINAAFTLGMAFRGYQVQQISLYISEDLFRRIGWITSQNVVTFDIWRRIAFQKPSNIGKPEGIRRFYYTFISILPFAVSATILVAYGRYEWVRHTWYSWKNLYFYLTCIMVLAVLIVSILTSAINKKWVLLCKKRFSKVISDHSKAFPDT